MNIRYIASTGFLIDSKHGYLIRFEPNIYKDVRYYLHILRFTAIMLCKMIKMVYLLLELYFKMILFF